MKFAALRNAGSPNTFDYIGRPAQLNALGKEGVNLGAEKAWRLARRNG